MPQAMAGCGTGNSACNSAGSNTFGSYKNFQYGNNYNCGGGNTHGCTYILQYYLNGNVGTCVCPNGACGGSSGCPPNGASTTSTNGYIGCLNGATPDCCVCGSSPTCGYCCCIN